MDIATILKDTLFLVVTINVLISVVVIVGYCVTRFEWDILRAAGAVSMVTWVTWVSSDPNNVLYHIWIWLGWPAITLIILLLIPQPTST